MPLSLCVALVRGRFLGQLLDTTRCGSQCFFTPMHISTTHTVALLEVSESAYTEVRTLLERAGYHHALFEDGSIDMTGIALTCAPAPAQRGDDVEGVAP